MDRKFLILLVCHVCGIFSHESFFHSSQLYKTNYQQNDEYYSNSPFYGNHHYAYWHSQQDPTPQHHGVHFPHELQLGHRNAYHHDQHYYPQTYSYNDGAEFKYHPQYHYHQVRTALPHSLIEHHVVYDRQKFVPNNYHYQHVPHKYYHQYELHNEDSYEPQKYYDQHIPGYHYQYVPQMIVPRTYHHLYIPDNSDTKLHLRPYVPNFDLAFNNTNQNTPEGSGNKNHNVLVNSNIEPDENQPSGIDETSNNQENVIPTQVENRANVNKQPNRDENINQPEVDTNGTNNVHGSNTPVVSIETEGNQPSVKDESANNTEKAPPTQVDIHIDTTNNEHHNRNIIGVNIETEEKQTPVAIKTVNNQDGAAQPPAADLEVSDLGGKHLSQETSTVPTSQVRTQTIPAVYIRFGGVEDEASSEESEERQLK